MTRQRYAGFDGGGSDHMPERPPPPDPVRKLERENAALQAEVKKLRSVVETTHRLVEPYAHASKRNGQR
jgi:hypothetical protein